MKRLVLALGFASLFLIAPVPSFASVDPGTCLLGLSRDGVVLCPKSSDTVKIWYIKHWNLDFKKYPQNQWVKYHCSNKTDTEDFQNWLWWNYEKARIAFPAPFPQSAHRPGVDQALQEIRKQFCKKI